MRVLNNLSTIKKRVASVLGRTLFLRVRAYNEIGQLVTKKLHSTNGGTTFKQHVDQRYNIRGWLTRINDSGLSPDAVNEPKDFFGMNLAYNETLSGINNIPQYNGSISAAKFSTGLGLGAQAGAVSERGYRYVYDPMNRLTASTHVEKNVNWATSTSYHEDNLSYNLNGSPLSVNRKGANGTNLDQLTYTYTGNQVQSITDAGDALKGFVDGNIGSGDFTYNANGNRVTDKNKNTTTTYNHLNLPDRVTKGTGEYIRFVYDALGNKLGQYVYSAANALQKSTDYAGEFVYENDALKFIEHEEGRIIPEAGGAFTYQYVLRDHLGNERVTFTTKNDQDVSLATMENVNAATEQSKFLYYTEAVKINAAIFDHTKTGPTYYSTRLNGSANERTGLTKSLSVMAGDTVKAEVFVKYLDPVSSNWTTALNNLITSIANGTAGAGVFVDGGAVGSTGGVVAPYGTLLNKSGETGTAPKAYLNWLVFDRDYNFVNGGFVRMTTNAREYGQNGAHEKLAAQFLVTQPGYVYIYISNDNVALGSAQIETYWDDLKAVLVKSPVLQEDFYYSYGAVAKTVQREDAVPNKFLYQGKEYVDDLGLNQYDNEARWYDPWEMLTTTQDPHADKYTGLSPYGWVAGNPLIFMDSNGKDFGIYIDHEKKTITITANFVTTSENQKSANKAVAFWNAQSGKNVYVVGEGKDAIAYAVNYNITTEVDDRTPGNKPDGTPYASKGEERTLTEKNNGELNSYDVLPNNDKHFDQRQSGTETGGVSTGKSAFVRESNRNSETGSHEVGHNLGNSHDNGGLMSAVNSSGGIGPKNTGESLAGVGIGNGRIGKDVSGVGRINGTTGTAPTGFSSGSVMTLKRYERIQSRQK